MKKLLIAAGMVLLVLMNVRTWAQAQTASAMKSELENVLANFRASRDFGEVSLQQATELIFAEMVLVDYLLRGKMGFAVEQAMIKRDMQLASSVPSVAYLYDAVLNYATYEAKFYAGDAQGRFRLSKAHRRMFLDRMQGSLEYYYAFLRDLQYEISIDQNQRRPLLAQALSIGKTDSINQFCPIKW